MTNEESKTVGSSAAANEAAESDYQENFMPKVHHIGRLTMLVALFLSFLPIAFFFFAKGYKLPIATYISGIVGVVSIGIGMWLSEPEADRPVLGSAGTYISYLSGNVGGMRFPVASTVQKNMKADITTPRGQVVTIVGIVASVVANLIILLVIVLSGQALMSVLPKVIISSFSFVVLSMLGGMLVMNFSARGGIKSVPGILPYIFIAVAAWFLCNKVFPRMFGWGMAIAVFSSVLCGYVRYRHDLKKAEDADKK